jgi:hypothetical protein
MGEIVDHGLVKYGGLGSFRAAYVAWPQRPVTPPQQVMWAPKSVQEVVENRTVTLIKGSHVFE